MRPSSERGPDRTGTARVGRFLSSSCDRRAFRGRDTGRAARPCPPPRTCPRTQTRTRTCTSSRPSHDRREFEAATGIRTAIPPAPPRTCPRPQTSRRPHILRTASSGLRSSGSRTPPSSTRCSSGLATGRTAKLRATRERREERGRGRGRGHGADGLGLLPPSAVRAVEARRNVPTCTSILCFRSAVR